MEGRKMNTGTAKVFLSVNLMITTSLLPFGNVWAQCTENELQLIQFYLYVSLQAAVTLNYQLIASIDQHIQSDISPGCLNDLIRYKLQQQQYQGRPNGVIDHGGRTYSYGGITCGPSGCIK